MGPRLLKSILQAPLVLIGVVAVIIEESLWVWLGKLMERVARWSHVARLEAAISRLPPIFALPLFVLPWGLLLPLKLLALYIMATGAFGAGALLLAGCEIFTVAVLARLYVLCRPSLHQWRWFVAAEIVVQGWSDWAHRLVDRLPYLPEIRQAIAARWRDRQGFFPGVSWRAAKQRSVRLVRYWTRMMSR
jgi:hypothetical protein